MASGVAVGTDEAAALMGQRMGSVMALMMDCLMDSGLDHLMASAMGCCLGERMVGQKVSLMVLQMESEVAL